jgi:hypothetical protein
LVPLPPFLANKLIRLPELSIDTVLQLVLKLIADYDKKRAQEVAFDLDEDSATKEAPSKEAPKEAESNESHVDGAASTDKPDKSTTKTSTNTGEFPDDPILDSDDEWDKAEVAEEAPTQKASDPMSAPIPKKVPKPSSTSKCQVLLRHLWDAAYALQFPSDKLESQAIKMSLTSDPTHLNWCKDRHVRNNIGQLYASSPGAPSTPAGPAPAANQASPETEHLARQRTQAMMGLNHSVKEFLDSKSTEGSSTSVSKLHPRFREMIRRLSANDAANPRDPTDFFDELATAGGKASTGAIIVWNLHMKLQHWNIRASNGCIAAIAKGCWVWDNASYPNNFSILALPRTKATDYNTGLGDDSANLHLRANHGERLSDKDVKLLNQQGFSYSADVGETIKQLRNFHKIFSALCHDDSMLATNILGFITNIEQNEETYEAMQAGDPLFCLRLLFKVDLFRNRLFQECLVKKDFAQVDWRTCNFYDIHTSIMNGNFTQKLPENHEIREANSKRKASSSFASDAGDNSHQPSKKNKSSIKEKGPKGTFEPNTDQPHQHKLTSSDNYAVLLVKSKTIRTLPKFPGTNLTCCANYHIIGHCHSKCERQATHKKLDAECSQAVVNILKKSRDMVRQHNAQA